MADGKKSAGESIKEGSQKGLDNLADVWDKLETVLFEDYIANFLEILPSLAIALIIFIFFWIMAKFARGAAVKIAESTVDDKSLQNLFGTIANIVVTFLGLFTAASILFPGLSAGNLVSVLGLSSVAIGFAFKDIFQNLLAGILILAQRPFQINDQIIAGDYEGTVEDIQIRSTQLKTYSGERVIIPNSEIYSSAIQVRTAFNKRRTTFQTGIGYGEDIDQGREVILDALESCEQVLDNPEPQIYVSSHGDSSVNFDVRYWTDSRTASVVSAKNEVATRVKYALDEADIEIPYPYRTVEFFDMTDQDDTEIPDQEQNG